MRNAKRMRCPILWASLIGEALAAQVGTKVDFARDIQPLLREHCVECHGPSQQMRGLRLDRRRDAMPNRVGANRPRIIPGNGAGSLLYRRVSGTEAGARMPPAGPLRTEQINLFKAWIDEGAVWPGEKAAAGAEGGWTPLMKAALYGDAAAVRAALETLADPNARNDDGATALLYAVDNLEKTRVLLDGGANPNLRSGEGRTALLIAAGWPGSYPVVKLLLENGADVKARLPDGRGVFGLAVGARDVKLLLLLIDHGVDTKPLPLGANFDGCLECFDMLLGLAEPADLSGALQGAVRSGDLARMKMLLDRGAKAGANLLVGVALAPAAIPVDVIRTLIASGADVKAKTPAGLTLMDFAKRQGNHTLIAALQEAGVGDESPAPVPLPGKPAASVRAAVEKIIPGLQRADVAFLERAGCVSCHNNSLTAMTVNAARSKRVRVNERIASDQLRRIAAFLEENGERGLENEGIPGGVDTVSYILLGMAAEKYPGDRITDIWARYVKNNQSPDGRWKCIAVRPPLESSDFQVTAASIRSLRTYGPRSQRAEYGKAVARAVEWMEKAEPASTEDYAFKILGLRWGGGSQAAIRETGKGLLGLQRADGGWGQIAALTADAYATGQALVALRESGTIAVNNAAYKRGVAYLLRTQLADGSWYVRTRAPAFQPYFDSDFPHGPDQFISAAASNWAAMALLGAVR